MITAIAELAAEGLKLAGIVEQNMNRPDIVAAAVARLRQKRRDAVDQAQAVLEDLKASESDKFNALDFIRRVES